MVNDVRDERIGAKKDEWNFNFQSVAPFESLWPAEISKEITTCSLVCVSLSYKLRFYFINYRSKIPAVSSRKQRLLHTFRSASAKIGTIGISQI